MQDISGEYYEKEKGKNQKKRDDYEKQRQSDIEKYLPF